MATLQEEKLEHLRARMRSIKALFDDLRNSEARHIEADNALLDFVGDPEVRALHEAVALWCG